MEQNNFTETDYEKLTLTNDFMFGKVMQNERNCIDMLERLTGNHIDSVKTVVSQKVVKVTNDSKGVRYDVYVEDYNNVYDAEMQNESKDTDRDILSKRARYYQGLVDLNLLESGGDYSDLKRSYIIFICTFDPFDKDLCCYEFENVCTYTEKMILNDERKILFFNTKGKIINVDEDTVKFLQYLDTKQVCDDYTRRLERDVAKARMNSEWRVEYMKSVTWRMDALREGKKEGIVIGLSGSIIDFLSEYGEVSEDLKERICSENNIDVLKRWNRLSAHVSSIEEFVEKM